MFGQGWTKFALSGVAVVCGMFGFALLAAAADFSRSAAPRHMQEDAELCDVTFVDIERGWAVGDRGVIWHTTDGGRNWRLQPSGVACRLESVHFIDAENGWIAGGESQPYTELSRGVLLRTRDGGRTWARDPSVVFPALHRVKFFTAARGWVLADPSAVFPTGLFTTDDGGRSWKPVPSQVEGAWLTGDMIDGATGAVAGRGGALGAVRNQGLEATRSPNFGLRGLRKLVLSAPTAGWLVGDGGLILRTDDLGRSWQLPTASPPAGIAEHFNLAALAVRGSHCWIAGAPGTVILHTADDGQTWDRFQTGWNLPIHALHFADDQHGWAVGSLGAVLATEDGGRTWRRQRSGGTRLALLGVFAEAEDVPLELFARLSGNDGYLGGACILTRRDLDAARLAASARPARTQESLVTVGASTAETAWRFPLRQAGLRFSAEQIVEGWNRTNDSQGLARLEAELVRWIRCWRPEVVVTHSTSSTSDDPLGHLMNQAVLRAVELAADSTRGHDLAIAAGLGPWEVKKVYATLPTGELGSDNLTTAQIAPRLGSSLADQARPARGLLTGRYQPSPVTIGFRLLVDRLPQGVGERDFFSGIQLQPGGEARRVLADSVGESVEQLARAARRHRDLEAILARSENGHADASSLLGQAADMASQLDLMSAGDVLFRLAERYYQTGRWELAAETFELLATRYPDHPLTGPSLAWLVKYYASSEAAWRAVGGQRTTVVQASAEQTVGESHVSPAGLATAARSALALGASDGIDRASRAGEIAKLLEERRPALFAEPEVRFPLAAAHRRQGFTKQADRFYLAFRGGGLLDAWRACAAGEHWLAQPGGAPPKAIWRCSISGAKPRLDGRLDDAVWRAAKPVVLQSALRDDGDWPAVALLAYDREFLYLAVECRKAPGVDYSTSNAPRPRDADLAGRDRVEIYLDLDRDWSTAWRLVVDHRGWTAESCWGDASWNPDWFVAARSDETTWTVEAAVPFDQLTGEYPTSKTVWAAGAQRIAPGVGFQSWTTPAAAEVMPEGFGYLIFD